MKIGITNYSPFVDQRDNSFVEGRLSVYLRDSDTLADTYTLEAGTFVQAENPVLLHAGIPDDTLFADAGIYRLKVEKYTGPTGSLSVESPDGYFEQIDIYEVGFDWDSESSSATVVENMEDLATVDPSVGSVTVLCHDSLGDCVPRTYIWDESAVDTVDGGYVVGSNVSDTGRWILLWGDEILPCTVYGVTPENTGNLNLLLNYPLLVGSFHIVTAPCVRFLPGDYDVYSTFVTDKELCFDDGARFTAATFTCPCARTFGGNSSYVADFNFTDKATVAHSSWFRSVYSFWTCGASTLIIDATNYFTNKMVYSSAHVNQATIVGRTRIDATYGANGYLYIENCTIVGAKIFSPSLDRIRFRLMDVKLEWFNSTDYRNFDFGLISQGHRLQVRTRADVNQLSIENFLQEPSIFVLAILADEQTVLDGTGLEIHDVLATNEQLTTIKNVAYTGSISDSACNNWQNVTVSGTLAFVGSSRNVYMKGCNIALSGDTRPISYLSLTDCTVRYNGKFCPSYTEMHVKGGTFSAPVELSDSAKQSRTKNKTVVFDGVDIDMSGASIWVNSIEMRNCRSSAHVYLVPYSADGHFYVDGTFDHNRFIGGSLIDVNVKDPITESAVREVLCNLAVTNNSFEQEDSRGIAVPRFCNDFVHTFVDSASVTVYRGNIGKCPRECTKTFTFKASNMTRTWGTGGNAWHFLTEYYEERVWNMNTLNGFFHAAGNAYQQADSQAPDNVRPAYTYMGYLLHIGDVALSDAKNDQFLVCPAWQDVNGYDPNATVILYAHYE